MAAEEKEKTCGPSTGAAAATDGKVVVVPMDLLDEYWFFHNTLRRSSRPASSIFLPSSPHKAAKGDPVGSFESSAPKHRVSISKTPSENDRKAARKLLRAPSMPAYRSPQEEHSGAMISSRKKSSDSSEGRIDATPHALVRAPSLPAYCEDGHEDTTQRDARYRPRSTMRISKLQHCLSSCEGYRRAISSSGWHTASNPRMSRLLPPRYWKEGGKYFASQTHLFIEVNSRRSCSIQGKKWRSYSDLESFEVQGFKDLGFVFDEEGSNTGSLADVIPGLRGNRTSGDDGGEEGRISRPYLSEAWSVERCAPPKLEWEDKRSAADMKEQLRFWARAVACNVRQEC